MKKRGGLDALILLALLIVLAVVSLQVANRNADGDEGPIPRRSSYSARPGGWKAAYLLLQDAGVKTGRTDKPPHDWSDRASVVIAGQEQFASSEASWNADQAQDALAWVNRGGTLICLTAQPNAVTDAIGVTPVPGSAANAAVNRVQAAPYLADVSSLLLPSNERFMTIGKDATVLYADAAPAVIVVKRGAGRVIAVSTPAVWENKHLAAADNARFLVRTAQAYARPNRPDGVVFDEFHQGYAAEQSFWNALGQPGQFALLQLALLCGIVCYCAGTRFGLPRAGLAQNRLSSEYVASLAGLYRRARASDAALEGVYLSFWRDLCRAVGMPLDSDAEQVARRAAASLGSGVYGANASEARANREMRLTRLLQTCETKIETGAKRLPDAELLGLARGIEEMRKELELGRDERRD